MPRQPPSARTLLPAASSPSSYARKPALVVATSRGASTRPVSGHSRPASTIYYPPEVVTSSPFKDETNDNDALHSFFSEELELFSFTTPSPTSPAPTSSYGTRTRSVDQLSPYQGSSGSSSSSSGSSINSIDSYGPPQSVSTTSRPSETIIGYRYQYPPTRRPISPSFKSTPPSPTPYRSSPSTFQSPSPQSKPGFNPIHPSSFQGHTNSNASPQNLLFRN